MHNLCKRKLCILTFKARCAGGVPVESFFVPRYKQLPQAEEYGRAYIKAYIKRRKTHEAAADGRRILCSPDRPCLRGGASGGGEPEPDGGRFVTVSCGSLTGREEDIEALACLLAGEITELATLMLGRAPDPSLRVLVAGLGNDQITPDAVGPGTAARLSVTRHLKVCRTGLYEALGCCELSALVPGVLGRTGMEAADLVRQAVSGVRAELVVAVDALAARSCRRLAATVQLSDRGISPGAGIGNMRAAIDRDTVGCPVLALGVPTVVDSATLVLDALEQAGLSGEAADPTLRRVLESGRSFIVSPGDCDRVVDLTCRLLARALDMAFGIERTASS